MVQWLVKLFKSTRTSPIPCKVSKSTEANVLRTQPLAQTHSQSGRGQSLSSSETELRSSRTYSTLQKLR